MARQLRCGPPPLGRTLSWLYAIVMTAMPLTMPFWGWQFWLLRPFILYASILPYLWVPLLLLCSLPCQLFYLFRQPERFRIFLRSVVSFLWSPYMRIWHGYEVSGLENIPPPDRGGLVVFYHGVLPMDVVFLSVVISQRLGRVLGGTMHRAVDRTPLIGNILRAYNFSADGREKMIEDLRRGALRAVAPGGAYETWFSENYSVEFGERCGFAAAAMEAGVPIIPMFTENIREYQRIHYFGFKDFHKYMFNEFGHGVLWAFGGLPVKLRTHLGKPMYSAEGETPQEFAKRVKKAIEDLRDTHQKMDNSIIRALRERFE